jgi:hypothetical protein
MCSSKGTAKVHTFFELANLLRKNFRKSWPIHRAEIGLTVFNPYLAALTAL